MASKVSTFHDLVVANSEFLTSKSILLGYGGSSYTETQGYSVNSDDSRAPARAGGAAPAARPADSSFSFGAARPAAPLYPARDWNDEFQKLYDEYMRLSLVQEKSPEHAFILAQHAASMKQLVGEFEERAVEIGQIIISELNLPTNRRKILPVNAGGIAGGEKCTNLSHSDTPETKAFSASKPPTQKSWKIFVDQLKFIQIRFQKHARVI